LLKVVAPRGGFAIPGDLALDAADWLTFMILRVGLSVNRASAKRLDSDDRLQLFELYPDPSGSTRNLHANF
jgi:hypothetical protein